MFDFVRRHTRLLQFVLLIVIFPSFALFGIQGYQRFTSGAAKDVAKIGRASITQGEFDAEYKRRIEMMRQRSPQIDVKQLDTPEARRQVLDAMVREKVIEQTAERMHLSASLTDDRLDRLFKADPQFAAFRNPDGSVNRDILASQSMSSEVFAARLRQDYALRQVTQAVEGTSFPGAAVLQTALDSALQQREVQVKRFDAAQYMAKVTPSDADIEAYYKSHEVQFRAKEQAQIEYVVLDADALAKSQVVKEEDLRKYYEENLSRYTAAEERGARHILIKAEAGAPKAEKDKARAKAEAILKEVRAKPTAFAEIAKKESQDPGSAAQGGDLGFFGRGTMVKPFEDAVFSMKTGDISNVVESDFGFHVIQLTGVRGGEKKSFESVRAEIEAERRKQLAQQAFSEKAEQFTNTVYEQPDSLQPAIEKFGLEKKTATVQRTPMPGAAGPLASAKLLDAVFGSDALRDKRNTQAIETGPNQLVSARVLQHTPERTLPLAEVKDQVRQAVQAEQAAAMARKDGEALLEQAKKVGDLPDAKTITVSRVKPEGQPREVVLEALKADLSKGPTAVGVDLAGVGYAVVKVLKVVPRDASDESTTRGTPIVQQTLANAEAEAYYGALKQRYKVKTYELAAPAANP